MIAANYRKFPEALMYQLELALADVCTTFEWLRVNRPLAWACWFRTMATAKDTDRGRMAVPEWVTVAKRKAAALARKVKAACMALVLAALPIKEWEPEMQGEIVFNQDDQDEPKAKPPKMIEGFYYGPMGETWSGRGLMPKWLRMLVSNGNSKEAFLYQPKE